MALNNDISLNNNKHNIPSKMQNDHYTRPQT